MYDKQRLDNQSKLQIMKAIKLLAHKESFIGLYFLLFIMGVTVGSGYGIYNESRIAEIALLLGLGAHACFNKYYMVTKKEWLFFAFIVLGSFFWTNALFIVIDLLLFYCLYKSFFFLEYRPLVTKVIILASFSIFLLLPVALWDYLTSGIYSSNWYLLRLNIRIYNSYLLIMSILAVWLYLTEKYKNIYLFFVFLAFLSILMDGGRSATLAYTAFVIIICIFRRPVSWQLGFAYSMSWLTYLTINHLASLNAVETLGLGIARATTSQRYDIWMNAVQCWVQNPIWGCGFYQLDSTRNLASHPHNLFLQVLSETGLIGFGFLLAIIFSILKNISWNLNKDYFVIAALLAVVIETLLSGIHIYPITQIALLWLFIFLLKNPIFPHTLYFNSLIASFASNSYLSITVYLILTIFFLYFFINTSALIDPELLTRPRFLENGYNIF